jgi:hypothetical protein
MAIQPIGTESGRRAQARLTAGDNNPAGEFLISIMAAAADEGDFSFGG